MKIAAAREGVPVGHVYEDERRFEIRVLEPPSRPSADGIGDLFVTTRNGENVPLREIVTLSEGEGPRAIRRENRTRAVRVDVNLRGRDLVSWVSEAQAAVKQSVRLPTGYRVEWGGQFENFERAQARLAIVVPVVILLIFAILLWSSRICAWASRCSRWCRCRSPAACSAWSCAACRSAYPRPLASSLWAASPC